MAKSRQLRTNFSSGLLSPGMQGRIDLQAYNNGCQVLTNWWPLVTGGMRRRPGSVFLNRVDSTGTTIGTDFRVEPFVFNETQQYVIVFHVTLGGFSGTVKIYDPDDGTLLQSITGAPWSTSGMIRGMSVAQLGDTMFIASENFQTRKLVRTGASTFTLSTYEFETSPSDNGYPHKAPFYKFADPEVTITPSGEAGTVTVTASAAVFDSTFPGRLIRYRGKQMVVTKYLSTTQVVADVKEQLPNGALLTLTRGNAFDYIIGEIIVGRDTGIKAQVVSINTRFALKVASVGGDFADSTVKEELEGLDSGNITALGSASSIDPPPLADWDEIAFSDSRGWPDVVAFHSQRLWFGGSSSLPAHIFGSKVAAFFNFDVGDAFPDESIQALIADSQITKIEDIVSANHMLIFCDSAEFYVPERSDRPLTPESFSILVQSRYGIRPGTRARLLDEGTIFIQSNGSAVREMVWSERLNAYSAEPISLLSERALQDVQEVAVLYGGYERPEHVAFFINKTKQSFLSWYHTSRAEQIRAWGIWDSNVTPTHASNISGTQDTDNVGPVSIMTMNNKLFALMRRSIWDESANQYKNKIFLERFELDATMDAQLPTSWSGSARKSWTNVHPELTYCLASVTSLHPDNDFVSGSGQLVPGLDNADASPDYYLGDYYLTKDAGAGTEGNVLLDFAVENLQVGLNFDQELSPMPPEINLADGPTTGMPKRIVSVDVLMNSSLALQIEGNALLVFDVQHDFSQPPPRFSGSKKFYLLGFSERPSVTLRNTVPLPCEVSAITMEVEF